MPLRTTFERFCRFEFPHRQMLLGCHVAFCDTMVNLGQHKVSICLARCRLLLFFCFLHKRIRLDVQDALGHLMRRWMQNMLVGFAGWTAARLSSSFEFEPHHEMFAMIYDAARTRREQTLRTCPRRTNQNASDNHM